MPLLEIIKGEKTSDETLYRALDLAKQIKKTPIVVNDSRGFFTSRVIGTFINEGVGMLLEGVPAAVDRAGLQPGRLPGPGAAAQRRAEPQPRAQDPRRDEGGDRGRRRRVRGPAVLRRSSTACSSSGRGGRLAGAGYYDYEDGKRAGLWKGLKELFPEIDDPSTLSLQRPRGADAVHRVDRGRQVPRRGRDRVRRGRQHRLDPRASASRAGPAACCSTSTATRARRHRPAGFVARARELAETYGERFEPPASLVEKAERGELYSESRRRSPRRPA